MINARELISEYIEQGFSKEDAVLLAKNELNNKQKCLIKSNRQAELNRIKNTNPSNSNKSVLYGPKKGVM